MRIKSQESRTKKIFDKRKLIGLQEVIFVKALIGLNNKLAEFLS